MWRRVVTSLGLVAAGVLVTSAVVAFSSRSTSPRVSRFTVTLPSATALTTNPVQNNLAIAPDGSAFVYVGDGPDLGNLIDNIRRGHVLTVTTVRSTFVVNRNITGVQPYIQESAFTEITPTII